MMFRRPDSPAKTKPTGRWRTWRVRLGLLLGLGLLGTGLLLANALAGAPTVEHLARQEPPRTSYMQRAILEGRLREDYPMQWVRAEALSPRSLCAVVMAEDPLFFRHEGFNHPLMLKALVGKLLGNTIGSSTLSQQLARNLFLSPEQTVSRKLREAIITSRLEKTLNKRRILELYINVAEWGPGVWGLAHASQHYLGKRPDQLTVFEAVFLASLLPAPTKPLADTNLSRAIFIQRIVLSVLHGAGVIDAAEWSQSQQRVEAVHRALHAGRPLQEALAMPVETALALPPAPGLSGPDMSGLKPAPVIPEERLLEEQCGLARAEAYFGPF